jgi:chromosome segregation ATPase
MADVLRAEQAGAVKALRQQMSEAAAKHMEDMEVLMAAHAHDMKALKASIKVHEAEHTDALEQASKRCKDEVKDFERRLKEVQEGHADVLLEAVAGKKAVTRLEAEAKAAEAAYQELEEDLRKARTAREMDMEMEEPARLEMEELRTQVTNRMPELEEFSTADQ